MQLEIPVIDGHAINPEAPLHRIAIKRIQQDRDLFVVVTAKDSDRGVGKTTFALWLALSWTEMFTSHGWWCDADDPASGMATVEPDEFFDIVDQVGKQYEPGTVIFLDEAEQLTGRRAMDDQNVEFIQRMQMMRKKQAISILALPDPSALDPGIEALSDVWVNVTRRGHAMIHRMGVESYGSRNNITKPWHRIEFPDVSDHPQMDELDAMKDEAMDSWAEDDEDDEDDDELSLEAQALLAKKIKERVDCPWADVPDHDERLTYSGPHLSRNLPEVNDVAA